MRSLLLALAVALAGLGQGSALRRTASAAAGATEAPAGARWGHHVAATAAAPARHLLQEGDGGSFVAPEGEISAETCLHLQGTFGASCQVGIDRVALIFQRGSTSPPTPEQVQEAVASLQTAGLPTKGCWASITSVMAARCGCNPGFLAYRELFQLEFPGLAPPYLRGVNAIFATACGWPDTSCA